MQILHYRTNDQYRDHLAVEAKRRWNEANIAGAAARGELGEVRLFRTTRQHPGTINLAVFQAMSAEQRSETWANASEADKRGLAIQVAAIKGRGDEWIGEYVEAMEAKFAGK